ncbi:MAG: cobaltochelatase subunit CobT [Alphaproteobacteria bacterium]
MATLKSSTSTATSTVIRTAPHPAAEQKEKEKEGEGPDNFLQALESAVHALCGDGRARLRFARGAQSWGMVQVGEEQEEASLRLPGPPQPRPYGSTGSTGSSATRLRSGEEVSRTQWLNEERRAELRGLSDQAAFQLRFHDPSLHKRLAPRGGTARQVFERMERARCDAIGMRRFVGASDNIEAASLCQLKAAQDRQRRFGPEAQAAAALELMEASAALVRACVCGRAPPEALRQLTQPLEEVLGRDFLDSLKTAVEDQSSFADFAWRAMRLLNVPGSEPVENAEAEGEEEFLGEEEKSLSDLSEEWDVTEDTRDRSQPELEINPSALSEESGEGMSEEDEDAENQHLRDFDDGDAHGREDSIASIARDYRVFTTDWDETEVASNLCSSIDLDRHRAQLDRQLSHLDGTVQRLANRLHRRLLARQNRWWQFDLDDGLLDASRLARVVVNPSDPLSFKIERESEFRDTVVTLLLDNSGSMRGRPITIAALSADILARTLEKCNVRVEILGFTTASWKGGRARERWQEMGRSDQPGRLNDLRHIIYKSAEVPFRRVRRNLGLMMRDGILKENIDGEALVWAHERLLARAEQRRILMVISDGAPVDDSTLSANPGNYLEQHLQNVIKWIERRSPVELIAIGIGHDVTRYYRRAVTISDAEDLGGVMMEELASLFDEDYSTTTQHRPIHH